MATIWNNKFKKGPYEIVWKSDFVATFVVNNTGLCFSVYNAFLWNENCFTFVLGSIISTHSTDILVVLKILGITF